MVSILPNDARSGLDVLTKHVGRGIENALPQVYENQKREMGLNAINQLKSALNPQNNQNPGDVLSELARAISLNPSLERSGIAEHIMKLAQANASHKTPLPNARDRSEIPQIQSRQPGPNFLDQPGQENKFFPNNIGPQGGPGNVPQEATSGQKVPIKTPQQLAKEAPEYAKQLTANNEPTTTRQAYEMLKAQNDDARMHNESIDKELQQRVAGQSEYGKRGMEYLQKHHENASPELETIFQRKGEEASREGKSEADINRYLDKEAQRIGNVIKNITSKPTANRSYNKLGRALNGTYRNFDEAAEDIRKDIKPLIDEGLYDFSRKLVQDLGYYPEEREIILNQLTPGVQSAFNSLNKIGDIKAGNWQIRPNVDLEPLKSAIQQAQKADPNFSQILGRKMSEDKGYSWENYKNALNELEDSGEFKLSGDQATHRGELDNPPMTFLSGILHDLGFTGR